MTVLKGGKRGLALKLQTPNIQSAGILARPY